MSKHTPGRIEGRDYCEGVVAKAEGEVRDLSELPCIPVFVADMLDRRDRREQLRDALAQAAELRQALEE